MLEINKIYLMDCLDFLKQIDDNSVDFIYFSSSKFQGIELVIKINNRYLGNCFFNFIPAWNKKIAGNGSKESIFQNVR